tara:strand:+ start:1812 stop:2180 length:369 start_codon:yes stop_codon:yes gene_type:complete
MKIKIKRKSLKESKFPTPAKLAPLKEPAPHIDMKTVNKDGYFGSSEGDDEETGIMIPYTDEGIIDWERMTPEQKRYISSQIAASPSAEEELEELGFPPGKLEENFHIRKLQIIAERHFRKSK